MVDSSDPLVSPAHLADGRAVYNRHFTHSKHSGVGESCAKVLELLGADNPEETEEILSLMHRTRILNNSQNVGLENFRATKVSGVNGFPPRLLNRSSSKTGEALPCSSPERISQKVQRREPIHLNSSLQPPPQCEGCEQSGGRLSSAHCNSCTKSFQCRLPICTDRVMYEEAHPLPAPLPSPPASTQKMNRSDGSAIVQPPSPLSGVLFSPNIKMFERSVTPQTPLRRQHLSSQSLETASSYKNRETAMHIHQSPESPVAGRTYQDCSQLASPGSTFLSTPSSSVPHQSMHQLPLRCQPKTALISGSSSDLSSQQSPQSRMYGPQCPRVWIKGQRLGQGSFGTVYEGWNLEDGSFFAVKISKQEDVSPEIQQEVTVLSQLSHPNIVHYLGSSIENGCFCIFLELVRMGSLESILRKYGYLEEQVIRMYTRQILHGLEYLHQRNTIHRDIKCANILVDVNGQVKLADFGVAKRVDLSLAASCKGTPLYMAPEVMKSGQKSYGLLADIWSLGCTVLEMADGKPPWSDLQGFAFYFKVRRGELPPIPGHLSAEARRFILSCLKLKPDDRPTASELLQHPFVANALIFVPPVPWLSSSLAITVPSVDL